MYHVYRKHPDGRGHVYHLGSYKTEKELFHAHRIGELAGTPDRRVRSYYTGLGGFRLPEFVFVPYVVNDSGTILSEETLLGLYRKVRPNYYYSRGWKRSNGHYYRHPHTTQERRIAAGVIKEDGEPEFRGSRRPHTLPDTYDDIVIASRYNNNWKRYRDHQWK